MPGESGNNTKALFEAPGKTMTVHFSSIVGGKVSKKLLIQVRFCQLPIPVPVAYHLITHTISITYPLPTTN